MEKNNLADFLEEAPTSWLQPKYLREIEKKYFNDPLGNIPDLTTNEGIKSVDVIEENGEEYYV